MTDNLLRELERREIEIYPSRAKEEPRILLPLKVMMKSLQSRFEYHFSGDRPTNKLDKVCIIYTKGACAKQCSLNTFSHILLSF